MGANSFLLSRPLFQTEIIVPKHKQEVTKVVSLIKIMAENLPGVSSTFNSLLYKSKIWAKPFYYK